MEYIHSLSMSPQNTQKHSYKSEDKNYIHSSSIGGV